MSQRANNSVNNSKTKEQETTVRQMWENPQSGNSPEKYLKMALKCMKRMFILITEEVQ